MAFVASIGKGAPPQLPRSGEPSLPTQTTSAAPQLPKSSSSLEEIAAEASNCDKISQLPDSILVSIISRLTVVEAVCTSILSTRWRHLSTYITRLDFTPTPKQQKYFEKNYDKISKAEFIKYTINHTLDSHKGGQFLDEFRLCLPFFSSQYQSSEIGRWLEFAFSKQVQIIDLHVHTFFPRAFFPFLPCLASRNEALPAFKSLKELSLGAVDLGDEDLELLLSNFIVLERLSIEYNGKLRVVSIVGDLAPKLKHLNLRSCSSIETVEIRGLMNLVSLRCHKLPPSYELMLENVPRLIEFATHENCGFYDIFSNNVFSEQLVKLKLSTNCLKEMPYDDMDELLLPKFVKLKHMELAANMGNDGNIHQLVHMIEACPCLEKLEIKFTWLVNPFESRWDTEHRFDVVKEASNDNLKKVKLSGFLGYPTELEFGSYIVRKAVALEELVVDICPVSLNEDLFISACTVPLGRNLVIYTYADDETQPSVRARVWQHFRPELRDSVNLVVV
ncbi:hypothetical protein ABFX02_04G202900 [Erythranthe guttata]